LFIPPYSDAFSRIFVVWHVPDYTLRPWQFSKPNPAIKFQNDGWRAMFSKCRMKKPSRKETIMPKTRERSSPAAGKPRTAKTSPTREEISLRAYHIYLERSGAPGNELEDWIRAERELLGQAGKAPRKAEPKSIAAKVRLIA